jgi:hypothetical protein
MPSWRAVAVSVPRLLSSLFQSMCFFMFGRHKLVLRGILTRAPGLDRLTKKSWSRRCWCHDYGGEKGYLRLLFLPRGLVRTRGLVCDRRSSGLGGIPNCVLFLHTTKTQTPSRRAIATSESAPKFLRSFSQSTLLGHGFGDGGIPNFVLFFHTT